MAGPGAVPVIALLVLLLFAVNVRTVHAKDATGPNIVFIVIDTLRRDHVGCYGYHRNTTPNLDRFAREGVRFEQMIAASSWTMPGIMTMFTSLPPTLHNATSYKKKLRDGVTTLAAELGRVGYQTVGIVSNPTASAKFGFGRGFDLYDDFTVPLAADLNLFQDFDEEQRIQAVATSPLINRVAFNWLEKKRRGKFFLFLLYLDPHADYSPPPPFDRMFDPDYTGSADGSDMHRRRKEKLDERDREHIIALYDGEIRYTDEHVGRFLKKLDALGLAANTLVVIVADHGEEFWEHGGTLHGHTLYEELVRVPCMIRYPGKVKGGRVVKEMVCHIDLMPTLLALAGARVPAQCKGRGLADVLVNGESPVRDAAFLETEVRTTIRAIRTPTHKFILRPDTRDREAYDLAADPHERRNVIDSPLPWVMDLSQRFDAWWNRVELLQRGASDGPPPPLDAGTLKKLKGLGYIR